MSRLIWFNKSLTATISLATLTGVALKYKSYLEGKASYIAKEIVIIDE
jgi:hypothetical protein